MTAPIDPKPIETLRAYHERTKHHLHRYAAGPGQLDWEHQPDPFRRFADAPLIPLPLLADDVEPSYELAREGRAPAQALDLPGIAAFFELSLGLAAWKQYGPSRWALRCNPSSGNLHPTEGYLVSTGIAGLGDGVYHYAPEAHALEWRCRFSPSRGPSNAPLAFVALAGIPRREAWKYGERAFRYVQLDVGHALGAFRYAGAALGWGLRLEPIADDALAALLGLDRDDDFADAEREWPDLLLRIAPTGAATEVVADEWTGLLERFEGAEWRGRANRVDPMARPVTGRPLAEIEWPVIDEAARAAHAAAPWPPAEGPQPSASDLPPPLAAPCATSAAALIRTRRSAQAYDGATTIPVARFYALLDRLLHRATLPPWDLWPLAPRIHLALFVHRVEGLPRGLYALPRSVAGEALMRAALRPQFEWSVPADRPAHIPLFRLIQADARNAARTLSCHQEIAADGAFSLGMLAEFDGVLTDANRDGSAYRRLYWEAGLIGQVLYLEAEAADLRGTGIGCFFDDAVHETLGIVDHRLQSLYHFTLGGPLHDQRIQTLPAYAHLAAPPHLDEIKGRISAAWAKRERLKAEVEASGGRDARRAGWARLEALDLELSALDSRFKSLAG